MDAGELLATMRAGAAHFALPLSAIERVLSAAMPVALPSAGAEQRFGLRLGDDVLPVFFAASLFGAERCTLRAQDKIVVLAASGGRLAVWVDAVEDIVPYAAVTGEGDGLLGQLLLGFSGGERTLAVLDPAAIRSRLLQRERE